MNPKSLVLRASELLGVTRAVSASQWRAERVLILCYHGVSLVDEDEADPTLFVNPALLRQRLTRLAEAGATVLRLGEALARLAEGTLPKRAVVLTFDDGTRDFAEVVVPLLAEFGMPATVYVSTYYCEHPFPVFDAALRYLLWRGRASGADLAGIAGCGAGRRWGLATAREREEAWGAIYDAAQQSGASATEKHDLLRMVATRAGIDFPSFLASGAFQQMTPEQIGALPRALVDVELHTHRHRTPRDLTLFAREIEDNREALQRYRAGSSPAHFCYPSGNYRGEFVGWLRALGVKSATTCVPGLASRADDRMLLPRFVDTSLTSRLVFDAWVSGVAALMPRRARHRLDPALLGVAYTRG
jgi:peptidoglycan/xylan/chitin deacetylase (PgdA/CDA1 family)